METPPMASTAKMADLRRSSRLRLSARDGLDELWAVSSMRLRVRSGCYFRMRLKSLRMPWSQATR